VPLVPIDSVSVRPDSVNVALVAVPVAAIVADAIALAVITPLDAALNPVNVCVTNVVPPARMVRVAVAQPVPILSAIWFLAAVLSDGMFSPLSVSVFKENTVLPSFIIWRVK